MNQNTEQLTHWAVALLLLLVAYTVLNQGQWLAGSMFALAGTLLIPPVWQWLVRRLRRPVSGSVRLVAIAALGITASGLMSSHEKAEASRPIPVVAKRDNTLLCTTRESLESILQAEDPINRELERTYRNRPAEWARITTTDAYLQRSLAAAHRKQSTLVSEGQCILVPLGEPLTTARQNLTHGDLARVTEVVSVSHQGRSYWAYAGGLQESREQPAVTSKP